MNERSPVSPASSVAALPLASDASVTRPTHAFPRILSLDGLRAISIVLVLVGHARHGLPALAPGWPSRLGAVIGNQSLGVSIFFVLSGFLITTLLLREESERGQISLSGFYLRRAFRILPAFYTYVLAIWILNRMFEFGIPARHFLSAITFTWNYVPDTEGWWLGHTWSLCVEEQFYLLWPLILRTAGRKRATWVAATLVMILPLVRMATYAALPEWRGRIPIMLHTRIDILMFGCLLALLPWDGRVMTSLKKLVAQRGVQVAFLGYLFVASPLLIEQFHGKFLLPVGLTLEGICIALLLLWTVHMPETALGRFLNLKWVARIGVLSYSLYLWQQAFTAPLPNVMSRLLPFNLIAAYLVAECSYRLVEQPLLRLRKKLVGA